jgi:hypothetical protein
MLAGEVDTLTLTPFRQQEDTAAQPPLCCYFVFKEEGESFARGSGGMLPAVVFTKLQAKCACWAQATSNTEPRLSRHHADVTFGSQRFELKLAQERCTIEVVLRVYSRPDTIISLLREVMLNKILAESFPSLTYDINVRDANSGIYLPLERVRLELKTRKNNVGAALGTFNFRGGSYECAQFESWIQAEASTEGCDANFATNDIALYEIFICAHESDLEFVCRLTDCLNKLTNGRARVTCSNRVSFGIPQQRVFSQHEAIRQDLFNITNSVVFVSGTY